MGEQPFIAKSLMLMGGFLVWAFHLGGVYALTSLACTRGVAEQFGQANEFYAIVAVTLVSLVADGALIVLAVIGSGPGLAHEEAKLRSFWRLVTGLAAALSAVAVLWQAVPALLVAPCP